MLERRLPPLLDFRIATGIHHGASLRLRCIRWVECSPRLKSQGGLTCKRLYIRMPSSPQTLSPIGPITQTCLTSLYPPSLGSGRSTATDFLLLMILAPSAKIPTNSATAATPPTTIPAISFGKSATPPSISKIFEEATAFLPGLMAGSPPGSAPRLSSMPSKWIW